MPGTGIRRRVTRQRGIRIDEPAASGQVRINVEELEALCDKMHQGCVFQVGDTFTDFVLDYQLVGRHAQNYPPDLNTDAAACLA